MRNNTGLVFFWSIYSLICLGLCINVLRIYVGYQRAHVLVVIARICGEKMTTHTFHRRSPMHPSIFRWNAQFQLCSHPRLDASKTYHLVENERWQHLSSTRSSHQHSQEHRCYHSHRNAGSCSSTSRLSRYGDLAGSLFRRSTVVCLAYVFYVCALPKDGGFPCHGNSTFHFIPSHNDSLDEPWTLSKTFQYDPTVDQCLAFEYQGCGGNWNRFSTAAACSNRCRKIPTFPHCLKIIFRLNLDAYLATHHSYVDALFTTKLGLGYLTGVIEFLLGALIYAMCLPYVRKSGYFQVGVSSRLCVESLGLLQIFYWCHMLTLPWLIIMMVHGVHFWKWLIVPGCLYMVEKVLRYRKSRSNKHGETFIMEAILLPSQVIHLVINRPRKFIYKPGDYIYINIPAVASFEWHPFSISSAPEHKGRTRGERESPGERRLFSDSLWLHVRACGHWTRRVYDLFRVKLQQEHGISFENTDSSDLRTSMRCRMSKSYIDGLRGREQPARNTQCSISKHDQSNLLSENLVNQTMKSRESCVSLPQIKHESSIDCPECRTRLSLPYPPQMTSSFKSILPESNGIILEETSDLDEEAIPTEEPILIKHTDRPTVAPVGDYCIRMSNTSSTDDDQQDMELNESRPSDALGYLRMYQNDNRVRYNALEFNDREDLQVSDDMSMPDH